MIFLANIDDLERLIDKVLVGKIERYVKNNKKTLIKNLCVIYYFC